ncbi:MAG: PEP-CTERM sorting domain-containing protein [Phycisphaerae bacterium]|nr:PEP-CTERM sorting domain-containing protein [Phycisphaerae bacterium]
MRSTITIGIILVVLLASATAHAAFIVEPHDSGFGYANFTGTPRYSSTAGQAPGLTATSSAYGNASVFPDVYTYTYTPQDDNDNWTVPLNDRYFGNGLYSTNLPGGQTGYYNVYITWVPSDSVSSLCDITITNEGDDVVWNNVNMNTNGTNDIAELWGPFPDGTVLAGANDKWLKIADQVLLQADKTYTVTQSAQLDTWTSMRSSGVMWEFVAVPEPATMLLLAFGVIPLLRRK